MDLPFNSNNNYDSVYTSKFKAGKRRTYFFDVKKTKGDDFYITLTEHTIKTNSDHVERHKIYIYKEDFNRFLSQLQETINHVKNELAPDFDYDEFQKKQEEWDANNPYDETKAALKRSNAAKPNDDMDWE